MSDPVSVRSATSDDARRLWEWANDPDTRANSFNQGPIPWEAHQAWFTRVLDDPDRHLLIGTITEAGAEVPFGMCRFDRQGDELEVSVNLAPSHRGRGLAPALLVVASDQVAGPKVARIKDTNIASKIAFERAGYTADGSVDGVSTYGRDRR